MELRRTQVVYTITLTDSECKKFTQDKRDLFFDEVSAALNLFVIDFFTVLNRTVDVHLYTDDGNDDKIREQMVLAMLKQNCK